jgi:hypothetical protein
MFLTVTGPAGERDERVLDTQGLSLGSLLGDEAKRVQGCLINGRLCDEWREFIPRQNDRVELMGEIGGIDPFTQAIIGIIISIGLSMVARALIPKPKKAKFDGKRREAYGIAGFNNTTGSGVPIPTWYGLNRVHGHVISSGVEISPDGREMWGKVLYCMGAGG